jgi:hypothetical protein
LFDVMVVLGRAATLDRLRRALTIARGQAQQVQVDEAQVEKTAQRQGG